MHKPLSGKRLLIVEDEMLVLMLVEEILSDLGCESVTVAATVKQALALVNAQPFDGAMLDVNLNGEKSFPIADALAAQGIQFVFATGYGADTLTDKYRGRPVLVKPYSGKDVGVILTDLLQNHNDALPPHSPLSPDP